MAGGRIDPERTPMPVNFAVMTISDSHDSSTDSSGDLLAQRIAAAGHAVKARAIVALDTGRIQAQARAWIDDPGIDVIVSNGGTGLKPHEVAPEAFRPLFERELEGFIVLWHLISYETVGVSTMQSRACAGIAGNTVIYVLPGSNGACRDGWDRLISLQIDSRHRPCCILEALPRFQKHR
jgi:molybdenum cofactor biosynthesis protein B